MATEKIDVAKGIGDAMQAKGEAAGDAVAFDVMDKEIGRTSIDLKIPADQGKYHKIAFDEQLKLNAISKVAFEVKPLLPAARKAP